MTYASDQRLQAAVWKRQTPTLCDAARARAPYRGKAGKAYDFCLPVEFSEFSLLPEVRETALGLFAKLGISWHAGTAGKPSNHLLSSQVQCVNALGQMMSAPDRLIKAFGPIVGPMQTVEQIESGRYLTFEYIGPKDYFHEAPNGQRIRGAQCTSVDAAFAFKNAKGERELALVEWKYTERYSSHKAHIASDEVRRTRYEPRLLAAAGPVRSDLLNFAHLLDEPLYQLVRQQLLAHAIETDPDIGFSRVRVLHVLPSANTAYQRSLRRAEQKALGATVSEVWTKLQLLPGRFRSIDSSIFLDPEITSAEYVHRYGLMASS